MARLWLAAATACHVLVFSAVPLLHTCDHTSAECQQTSCGPDGSASSHFFSPMHGRLCRLAGGCRAARGTGISRNGKTATTVGGQAWASGTCLACLYLQSAQSGSPFDAAKPVPKLIETVLTYAAAISDASPWFVLFDYPARAPPAVA